MGQQASEKQASAVDMLPGCCGTDCGAMHEDTGAATCVPSVCATVAGRALAYASASQWHAFESCQRGKWRAHQPNGSPPHDPRSWTMPLVQYLTNAFETPLLNLRPIRPGADGLHPHELRLGTQVAGSRSSQVPVADALLLRVAGAVPAEHRSCRAVGHSPVPVHHDFLALPVFAALPLL